MNSLQFELRDCLKILSFVFLSIVSAGAASAQSAPQSIHLAKVEFKGLEKLSQDQALEISGLRTGDTITLDMLDVASQRMMDSGMFARLSYRIQTAKNAANVVFEVEEIKGNIPVVFDNFVWFSENELFNAVKLELPTFDGTAPESGRSSDSIRKALTRVLRAANMLNDVEYNLFDNGKGLVEHVFSVHGAKIPICGLQFKGARDIKESTLIEESKPFMQNDYSRTASEAFPLQSLLPLYTRLGHLHASINFDSAKLEEDESCKGGVQVSYLVDEGPVYTWAGSEWAGNSAYDSAALDAALGMKKGEVANSSKIDKGFAAVRHLYGRKGFLALRVQAKPGFDDGARQVTYRIGISEGPQYKMGNLSIVGVPDADIARVKSFWKLAPGEVFDDSYSNQFIKEVAKSGVLKALHSAESKVEPDKERLTANVEITFKP
jgi:outer membrane protein insertion porin family